MCVPWLPQTFLCTIGNHPQLHRHPVVVKFLARPYESGLRYGFLPCAPKKARISCCGGPTALSADDIARQVSVDTKTQLVEGVEVRRLSMFKRASARWSGRKPPLGAPGTSTLSYSSGEDTSADGCGTMRHSVTGEFGVYEPSYELEKRAVMSFGLESSLRRSITPPPYAGESKQDDPAAEVVTRSGSLSLSGRPSPPPLPVSASKPAGRIRVAGGAVESKSETSLRMFPVVADPSVSTSTRSLIILNLECFRQSLLSVLSCHYSPSGNASAVTLAAPLLTPALAAVSKDGAVPPSTVVPFPPPALSLEDQLSADETLFVQRGLIRRQFLYDVLWHPTRTLPGHVYRAFVRVL